MKLKFIIIIFLSAALLTSCSTGTGYESKPRESPAESAPLAAPADFSELSDLLIQSWQSGSFFDVYKYASSDIKAVCKEEYFPLLFSALSDIGAGINGITSRESAQTSDGYQQEILTVDLDNITARIELFYSDLEIIGINTSYIHKGEFRLEQNDGSTDKRFLLHTEPGIDLNAAYMLREGEKRPAVLLIPGSGPADLSASIGILKPFDDLALALSESGISSLRMDKRTSRYADFSVTDGIDQEYITDIKAGIKFLLAQEETDGVYLLGHSLGSTIAAELMETEGIEGIVLLNGSLRSLAEIACDQYVRADPSNKSEYETLRDLALLANNSNCSGRYFFGASDYYWASLNVLDPAARIKNSNRKTLILNSNGDRQTFPADISLWGEALGNEENVFIELYDKASHFMYELDLTNLTSTYSPAVIPDYIPDRISAFILDGE